MGPLFNVVVHSFTVGSDTYQLINRTFWCTVILSIAYYLLSVLVDKCTQVHRQRQQRRKGRSTDRTGIVQPYKWRPTIRFVWSICYYAVSTLFLLYYHRHFVQPDVDKADGRYFPQYENLLFFLSSECNQNRFSNIFVVALAFQILGMALQVQDAEYTEAATRLFFTTVLTFLYSLSFEHYFLILHTVIGLYQTLTNLLFLIALHADRKGTVIFNVCAAAHFLSWSYVFLTLLPFDYLLPTLYMKPFNAWLNVFCWIWYGACVWNSVSKEN